MQALIFKCPHCQAPAETSSDRIGEPVECPRCQRPFVVEMPTAEVQTTHEGAPTEGRAVHTLDDAREEETLWRVHPAMFRNHPFLFLGYVALVGLGVWGMIATWAGEDAFLFAASGAASAVGAVMLLAWWIVVLSVTLSVTSNRTILRKGIIAKSTTEVRHEDVRNLQVDQNIFDRILNVGDIAISSSGQDDLEIVAKGIPRPGRLAELVRGRQEVD